MAEAVTGVAQASGRDESRGSGGRPLRTTHLADCRVKGSRLPEAGARRGTNAAPTFVSSSVFALHFTDPPVSAQLLAFLRVFCMTEGK